MTRIAVLPVMYLYVSLLSSMLLLLLTSSQQLSLSSSGNLRGNNNNNNNNKNKRKRRDRDRPLRFVDRDNNLVLMKALTINYPLSIFTNNNNNNRDWRSPAYRSDELLLLSGQDKPYADIARAQDQEDIWLLLLLLLFCFVVLLLLLLFYCYYNC